ncbi:MAG: hypothetical protein IJT61_04855 [Bacteroidales bacterium]|nr:hypothetical protein [Bacteroidales bacterium]
MKDNETKQEQKELEQGMPTCGIIMPISSLDGCTADHWSEVKNILSEAIKMAGYTASLVSDADDSGIIQKRIVQNIYDNDVVVCDVSGKNPNVMFELGMRLAFDKPTIIVIDDKTDYSFDTSPIEHISYPRDLRYHSIIRFKDKLKEKICATVKKSQEDPNYTTFLKNFGEFEVAHIEKKKGSINDILLSRMDDISRQLSRIQSQKVSPMMVFPSHDAKLRSIIQKELDLFCALNNIDKTILFLNKDGQRDRFIKQLEGRPEILELCESPKILRAIIDDITSPF